MLIWPLVNSSKPHFKQTIDRPPSTSNRKSCFYRSSKFPKPVTLSEKNTALLCLCKQRHSVGHTRARSRGRFGPQSSFRGRRRWRSVDIVDSNWSSYWTLGVDAVPATETRVASMMESCVPCSSMCVCVCLCKRARERDQSSERGRELRE